ncbi:MAG: hypothetical protein AUK34_00585 [Ignavibacteria bacterium CG2_30_36_16]|nr:MAG: hypothetical protein AUK34_00585 [Ignavibacteria bacterium CG2_30_36_16]PJA99309.1 MAG: hypothetical protein CO127_10825 [Ignavibacteria bacterium CG_4_9_14_3_um_filter_36_18]
MKNNPLCFYLKGQEKNFQTKILKPKIGYESNRACECGVPSFYGGGFPKSGKKRVWVWRNFKRS